MENQSFFKSKYFKFILPFVIVLGIIYLFKSGYKFGQWLYLMIN